MTPNPSSMVESAWLSAGALAEVRRILIPLSRDQRLNVLMILVAEAAPDQAPSSVRALKRVTVKTEESYEPGPPAEKKAKAKVKAKAKEPEGLIDPPSVVGASPVERAKTSAQRREIVFAAMTSEPMSKREISARLGWRYVMKGAGNALGATLNQLKAEKRIKRHGFGVRTKWSRLAD